MKITDPNIIKNSEKDLIDAVKEDIDLDAVNEILKKRLAAASLSANGGEIVVHNNEIAFRIDFDVQLSGSLMFDRQGTYIADEIKTPTRSDDFEPVLPPPSDAIEDAIEDTIDENTVPDDSNDDAEFDINLPEYSLDDEDLSSDDPGDGDIAIGEEENSGSDDLFEKELEKEFSKDSDPSQPSDARAETDEARPGKGHLDTKDDDMDDILKESRDFWEQKKDS